MTLARRVIIAALVMQRLLVSALLASTSLLAAPRAAAADTCSSARVMVVLDKSSSMVTGSINGTTKWDIAVGGLGEVLSAYESKAEFGLITYPQPSQCSPGQVDVSPALSNRASILGALSAPPPNAGNYTPMAQTLELAAEEPSLQTTAGAGARHVILISDGWQWCSPYDPATRFDGTPAVESLNAKGVTTWIVGFGAEVDTLALNRMAVAAGTAKMGCDPTTSDPAAPNTCYFQVDNAAQLISALNTIAGSISAETCDGVDNDCDGQVDEDLTRSCQNACGTVGVETCSAGGWSTCEIPNPPTETCDGVDNDCDGQVDEPGPDLCDNGDVCTNGQCQPPNDIDGDGGEMQAGCACDTGTAPGAGSLASMFLVGLALLRRRRR